VNETTPKLVTHCGAVRCRNLFELDNAGMMTRFITYWSAFLVRSDRLQFRRSKT